MIDYELYPNPNPDGSNKKRYHARVVSYSNISTEQLAEDIEERSGLSAGVVKDVLISFAEKLADYLGEGKKVHLEKVGYFQVNLRCKEQIRDPRGVRAEKIEFKSVSFRADNTLKEKLRKQRIKRTAYKSHSRKRTEASIDKLLAKYFELNSTITRQDFQRLSGQLRSTACRTIRKLVEAGKLKNIGADNSPVYVPGEGFYGK